MEKRDIIVIGASAGGLTALEKLVQSFPCNWEASVFVVWHMSPEVRGILPQVLTKAGPLPAIHASDGEEIRQGRIYIAPPDHHLLIEEGRVRVTRGPRENRLRPAIDPLFRSAAYTYGARVIGVILTGYLDDGTAGLGTIKMRGGLAVVQDPSDAEVPAMPESAIRELEVDYTCPLGELGALLIRLSSEEAAASPPMGDFDRKLLETEVRIANEDSAFENNIMKLGVFSPYTCPECHGVLSAIRDGTVLRYRCHTGHAFSPDALLASLTEKTEEGIWSAIRGLEEVVLLLNHMGDHAAEKNHSRLAALYFNKANEAGGRARQLRDIVLAHDQLNRLTLTAELSE